MEERIQIQGERYQWKTTIKDGNVTWIDFNGIR